MRVDATRLSVAVINPRDYATLDAVAFKTGKRVVPVVIPEFRMNQLLRRYCKAFRSLRAIDMNAVRPPKAAQEQAADTKLKAQKAAELDQRGGVRVRLRPGPHRRGPLRVHRRAARGGRGGHHRRGARPRGGRGHHRGGGGGGAGARARGSRRGVHAAAAGRAARAADAPDVDAPGRHAHAGAGAGTEQAPGSGLPAASGGPPARRLWPLRWRRSGLRPLIRRLPCREIPFIPAHVPTPAETPARRPAAAFIPVPSDERAPRAAPPVGALPPVAPIVPPMARPSAPPVQAPVAKAPPMAASPGVAAPSKPGVAAPGKPATRRPAPLSAKPPPPKPLTFVEAQAQLSQSARTARTWRRRCCAMPWAGGGGACCCRCKAAW